jgi:RNA polymerase subunit RPABC4/transcription elongation factor Spt4
MEETMKRNSTFKYVFWALLAAVILLVVTAVSIYTGKPTVTESENVLVMILPFLIILTAYIVIVGTLVFKDAAKRGMDPWLWATVAVFVPNLIGVVIYLVARQSYKSACINCGKGIQKDFKICPYCGQNQELVCENCKKTVARDWKVCPYCSHPLSETESETKSETKPEAK